MDSNISKYVDKLAAVFSPYRRDLMYGRSAVLRKIARFPFPLPIKVICEHGVDAVQVDLFEEKENPPGYLVFSKKKQESLFKLGKRNVIHIPDPFTYVVNQNYANWVRQVPVRFENAKNRKRLLFFYAHSTDSVIDRRSVDQYLAVIKDLKSDYDVTVCLHFSDIRRGVHNNLNKHGIDYVSISEHPRSKFCYSFFNLINQYDIACSTLPGSYLYYCSFVGMPFFLIKLPPLLQNIGDKAQARDYIGFFDEYPNKDAYDLFDINIKPSVSSISEKRRFVYELLGYTDENQNAHVVQRKIRSVLRQSFWR